jgi:stage III sporulation protein AF
MTWLTLWLKKIILLVLLAAFLDLILPNTSLQRYVKMVMGLILLLTIISPVLSLFSLSQDDLAIRLNRYQEELNNPSDAEWKRLTDKLLGQQNEQVTAYVEKQVASSVKASVKEQYGLDVRQVQVQVNHENPDQPVLERIELVIGEASVQGQGTVEPIKPIEPVQIQLSEKKGVSSVPEVEVAARQDHPVYAQMASDIARQWGLPEDQVVVTDESRQDEKQ